MEHTFEFLYMTVAEKLLHIVGTIHPCTGFEVPEVICFSVSAYHEPQEQITAADRAEAAEYTRLNAWNFTAEALEFEELTGCHGIVNI
jgi:hypothetical protein